MSMADDKNVLESIDRRRSRSSAWAPAISAAGISGILASAATSFTKDSSDMRASSRGKDSIRADQMLSGSLRCKSA